MKKLTAILLAVLMVSLCFGTTAMAEESVDTSVDSVDSVESVESVESVDSVDSVESDDSVESSDDEIALPEFINVSLGKDYTITSDAEDGNPTYNGVCDDGMGEGGYLTDGIVRDVEELLAAGAGDMDKSVELAGTNRTHFVTIEIGATENVGVVVLGTVRRGNNRYTNIAGIEALVNGAWVAVDYEEVAVAIEGAEQYGSETIEPYDQFFDVYAVFNELVNASAIKIAIDTEDTTGTIAHYGPRGYIAQLDEITVYSVDMPEESGDDTVDNGSTDVSDVVSTPDSSTDNGGNDTPITGDLGLGVFAVLAVVSLAGVVVAKKVK